jgi:hypothetical protein
MGEGLQWQDAVAEEGWWQIMGETEEYAFSISNNFTTQIQGRYEIQDLDDKYTYITPINSTDTIRFIDGSISVLETDTSIVVMGGLIGKDSVYYGFLLSYDPNYVDPYLYDEKTAEFVYDFEEYIVDTTYASSGIFKVIGATDSTYISLLMIMPEGKTALTAGEYPVAYGYDINFQTVQGGAWSNEYEMFIGSVAATLIEQGGKLYYGKVWYVNSGKVTVDEKLNITVDALNSKGKAVKATLKAPKDQAVENVNAATNAHKTIKNNQLIIEKNGMKYNVLGTRL